ncbi:hypothetical protein RFI_01618, partial [Reticulomyxa filosa]
NDGKEDDEDEETWLNGKQVRNGISHVSCGAFHSAALSTVGNVFCWGDNTDGQLGIGIGTVDDSTVPLVVDYLGGMDTHTVKCGVDFTFAISEHSIFQHPSQKQIQSNGNSNDNSNSNDNDNNNSNSNDNDNSNSNDNDNEGNNVGHKIQKLKTMFAQKSRHHAKKQDAESTEMDTETTDSNAHHVDTEKDEKTNYSFNINGLSNQASAKLFRVLLLLLLFMFPKSGKGSEENNSNDVELNKAEQFWIRTVLNDWEKQKNSPRVREWIWKVGIPPGLRSKVWPLAIGNQLGINQSLFEICHKRASVAYQQHIAKQQQDHVMLMAPNLNDGVEVNITTTTTGTSVVATDVTTLETTDKGRENTISYIDEDLHRTFPSLSYFQKEGVLQDGLRDLLQAYAFYRPDIGYIQGMSYIAANLLLYMDGYTAFKAFANLLNSPFFYDMLSMDLSKQIPRYQIFQDLFQLSEPQLSAFFLDNSILPQSYFLDWAITIFSKKLRPNVTPRIWDFVLMFGESYVYICAVAILKCLKPQLLQMDLDQVQSNLKKLPQTLTESQLINTIKTINMPKHIKRKLDKLNENS